MALLDDIAGLVGTPLVAAGMTRAVTLIKTSPGTRMPGAVTGGTNPTTARFSARGFPQNTSSLLSAGTLIAGVDRVVILLGSTIASGARPDPGDAIELEGSTSVIVAGGVSTDPARAVYTCQCKS